MGNVFLEPITRDVIRRANKAAAKTSTESTALLSADIERFSGALHLLLVFRDGTRLSIPRKRISEIAEANVASLKGIEISPSRDSISFPKLDVDISIPGLLHDLYGSRILAESGRAGGRRSTLAKTAAVRENGLKGGRPKKA